MKRLLFLLFIISSTSFSLSAQKIIQWNIEEPILGTIMGVSFNYSETDFNGADYDAYILVSKFDGDTLEDSENRFINRFNEDMRDKKDKFFLSRDEISNCPYTLVVHPKRFSKFGSFFGYVTIVNSLGETVVSSDEFSGGHGGQIGSFTNLIGDGYDQMAKRIRFAISTYIKKNKIK